VLPPPLAQPKEERVLAPLTRLAAKAAYRPAAFFSLPLAVLAVSFLRLCAARTLYLHLAEFAVPMQVVAQAVQPLE
jgi:hypothetical protein